MTALLLSRIRSHTSLEVFTSSNPSAEKEFTEVISPAVYRFLEEREYQTFHIGLINIGYDHNAHVDSNHLPLPSQMPHLVQLNGHRQFSLTLAQHRHRHHTKWKAEIVIDGIIVHALCIKASSTVDSEVTIHISYCLRTSLEPLSTFRITISSVRCGNAPYIF
jgi:hypothetical protein